MSTNEILAKLPIDIQLKIHRLERGGTHVFTACVNGVATVYACSNNNKCVVLYKTTRSIFASRA